VGIVGLALPCAEVVSLALAPFWALAVVWGSPLRRGERFATWLGLFVAFCMMWTLPLHAAAIMIAGPSFYGWLAPPFGIASLALGIGVSAVHRRRMEGEDVGDPRLAAACLAFGAAVALLLSPLVAATAGGYAAYAGTVALAMATQAWLLLPPNLVTRAGACAALFGVVGAAPLLALLR
jgi:hypothetical protein